MTIQYFPTNYRRNVAKFLALIIILLVLVGGLHEHGLI